MPEEFYPQELDHTVERLYGRPAPMDPNSYGLEIEAEGVPPDGLDWLRYLPGVWQTHADNSLRDGIEFVSNGGRPLTELPGDLAALTKTFTALKFTPVFGYRTSLHVHMNASNMTVKQLFNLFTLYTIFEAPMIQFGGEERRGNVHCLTVHDTNGVVDVLRRYLTGPVNFNSLCSRDRRYASFNWASLPLHGTIEFRSHRGTADQNTIMRWVNLLSDLKAAAMRFENPQDVVQAFSQLTPGGIIDDVFLNSPEFRRVAQDHEQALWEGVRLAQEVAYARTSWVGVKNSKGKKPSTFNEALNTAAVINAWGDNRFAVDLQARAGRRRDQHDPDWWDEDGFGRDGFDVDGYDREGYDRRGYSEDGFDRDGEPDPERNDFD